MEAFNRVQKALHTGSGLSFGAWQMLPGSNQARTIARCGFDWVLVDTYVTFVEVFGPCQHTMRVTKYFPAQFASELCF